MVGEDRERRPLFVVSGVTKENVTLVRTFLLIIDHHSVTVKQLSSETGIRFRVGSIEFILHGRLKMKKISA